MKVPYKVMKFMICDLSGEQCGDVWSYSEPMLEPRCEICDIFIEASERKLEPKRRNKRAIKEKISTGSALKNKK